MPLVGSLLTALARADGDALVLHTGECPYVVAPTGQTQLASRELTFEAMTGVVAELLPREAREALDTLGAVQHDLRPADFSTNERFTVVAARGGDDIWVEIRRHRMPADAAPCPKRLATDGVNRLLRIAAERGASTMYLTSGARPFMRIQGEIVVIEGEGALSEADVQALIGDAHAGAVRVYDAPGVGRVRSITFTDHRGPGAIFRMVPDRAISADQLGLSREIRDLCAESDGLVLVTGPRASGQTTLLASLVDIINRTRSEHIITLEHEITFVHVNRGSLISQREVRGDADVLAAVRGALREKPDVLVIEKMSSPEITTLALEAAQAGHFVIGGMNAPTATAAIDRMIESVPRDRRPDTQFALAERLRGSVAQMLFRKTGRGLVAAREVLLNSPAVGALIAAGTTSEIPIAMENARPYGMVTLNDALATLVLTGIVEARDAYRQAPDKAGLISALGRSGIDTSILRV